MEGTRCQGHEWGAGTPRLHPTWNDCFTPSLMFQEAQLRSVTSAVCKMTWAGRSGVSTAILPPGPLTTTPGLISVPLHPRKRAQRMAACSRRSNRCSSEICPAKTNPSAIRGFFAASWHTHPSSLFYFRFSVSCEPDQHAGVLRSVFAAICLFS